MGILLKCKNTFEQCYIGLRVLDHVTFDRFRCMHHHVYLSFDIYYVFNYDT